MNGGINFKILLSNISKAILETQYAIEKEAIHNFLSFFEEQNHVLKPLSREIETSVSESGERKSCTITAPLVTLIPHKGMEIQKAEITIKSNLMADEKEVFLIPSGLRGEDNGQENIGEEERCEIKLVFQSTAPVEGTQEIINLLNKSI